MGYVYYIGIGRKTGTDAYAEIDSHFLADSQSNIKFLVKSNQVLKCLMYLKVHKRAFVNIQRRVRLHFFACRESCPKMLFGLEQHLIYKKQRLLNEFHYVLTLRLKISAHINTLERCTKQLQRELFVLQFPLSLGLFCLQPPFGFCN